MPGWLFPGSTSRIGHLPPPLALHRGVGRAQLRAAAGHRIHRQAVQTALFVNYHRKASQARILWNSLSFVEDFGVLVTPAHAAGHFFFNGLYCFNESYLPHIQITAKVLSLKARVHLPNSISRAAQARLCVCVSLRVCVCVCACLYFPLSLSLSLSTYLKF